MPVAAVDRCIRLIEILVESPGGISLAELARRLALPKSAIHRMLATLAERGYVDQDVESQNYAGSLSLATLGFRCLDARHLPDAAEAVLKRLAAATGEYCRLALVDGQSLVWVACAHGTTQGLRYDPPMSHAVVLHATASGKAWLATMPEDAALRIACARGLAPPANAGRNAVRGVEDLRRRLAETRRRGYAIADDEVESGTLAYAMAVRVGVAGAVGVVGTVSVAGPHARMQRLKRDEVAKSLTACAGDMAAVWPLVRRQREAGTDVVPFPAPPGRRPRVTRSAPDRSSTSTGPSARPSFSRRSRNAARCGALRCSSKAASSL